MNKIQTLVCSTVVSVMSLTHPVNLHAEGPRTEILLREVAVAKGPLKGQEWRASENFDLSPPDNAQQLIWRIKGAQTNSPIRFSVALDVLHAGDLTLFTGLKNGASTKVFGPAALRPDGGGEGYYIGGISGASHNFTVQIYALLPDGQSPTPVNTKDWKQNSEANKIFYISTAELPAGVELRIRVVKAGSPNVPVDVFDYDERQRVAKFDDVSA